MVFGNLYPSRYGEPAWNQQPQQSNQRDTEISQHLTQDKSYEELRWEATEMSDATKLSRLNKSAISGQSKDFVNLKDVTKIILVIVGDGADQAQWAIHQPLLENHSDFAHAALKHSFKEKDDSTIRLPEEDGDAFAEFVKFVYTGCIVNFSVEMIVRMYTLADRLQAHKFADACYETLSTSDSRYETAHMKFIFDNTTENDRLRRLCISQVGKGIISGRYMFDTKDARNMLSEYMGELMQGVTIAVAERNAERPPFAWTPSNAPTEPAAPVAPPQQATSSGCHLFADPNVSQMFNDQQRAQQQPSLFNNPQTSAPPSIFGNSNGNSRFGGRPATSNPGTGLFGNNTGNSTLFGNRPANNSSSTGLFGAGLFGQQNNSNASGGLFRDQAYNDGYTAGVASLNRQNPFTTGSHSLVSGTGFGSSDSATSAQSNGLFSNSVRNTESDTGLHRGANAASTTNTGAATRGLFGDFGPSPFNVIPTTQTQNAGGLFGTPAFTNPDRAASTSSTQTQISGGLFGERNALTSARGPFSFPLGQQNHSEPNTQVTNPAVTTSTRSSDAAANNEASPTSSEDSSAIMQEKSQGTAQQVTPSGASHDAATAATSNSQETTPVEAPAQADTVNASENQISESWEDVPANP